MVGRPIDNSPCIAEELRLEETRLINWPRRLLHVPTWTSYEWQPGNIYGGHASPSYNAISYTWGRWRLPDNDMPDMSPLPVRNTNWSIPRVDPMHFSTEEFQVALQHACTLLVRGDTDDFKLPTESEAEELVEIPKKSQHETAVSFLWLDTACIDQDWGSPRSAAEIGRQAKIFQGAQKVFAWLTTHTAVSLERHFAQLDQTIESLRAVYWQHLDPAEQLCNALKILEDILSDPWFSSLWTLQEAHLRHDAFIMSRQGDLVTHPDFYSVQVDLDQLFKWCGELSDFCRSLSHIQRGPQVVLGKLYELLSCKGLASLDTKSPMAVYGAASQRCASSDCDYVYGIQQIFGLRLGLSSLSADWNRNYSRQELEEQLGEALMRQDPLMSQCYVYTQPTKTGTAWRINMNSVVPDNPPFSLLLQAGTTIEPRCILNTQSSGGRLLGRFEACMCSLEILDRVCYRVDWADGLTEYSGRNMSIATLSIFPDVANELSDAPEHSAFGSTKLGGGRMQRDYTRWLIESFTGDEAIQVLLLGYVNGQGSNGGYHSGHFGIGLLVQSPAAPGGQDPGAPEWRRLGLCTWDVNYRSMSMYPEGSTSDRLLLDGKSPDWITRKGTFG